MKITQVEVLPVALPYKNSYALSTGTAEMSKHVLVRLYTDEGIVGVGRLRPARCRTSRARRRKRSPR